ncbi:TetR/AcrR family transcriptional regulator [Nocardioides limicola]|uniref:TetR/AcrR family transcriptional regulator n=1 Tax=Nocardioides limicola TaxID=2803368 RepID=UPI00193BEC15|nr:TetR/AcrR family transcriptional regulator [Nocardioides sp. DJM-14]
MPTSTRTTAERVRAAHLGPDRRRPQVLDAALQVAVKRGLGAVTVGAVAEELGVTRPVVYACFADRVQMIEALLDREQHRLADVVVQALRSTGVSDDPEQAFVTGFQTWLRLAGEQPGTWRLLLAGQPDPAIRERFDAGRAAFTQQAAAWIGPAMQRWWHTEDLDRKLPVLVELFLSSCEAALRSMLDGADDWTPEELGEFLGRAIHRAFRDA